MDFTIVQPYSHFIVEGLWRTIQLVIYGALFGSVLAVALAFARVSGGFVLSSICSGFCHVIRGTPLLVQIYLLYYGLGDLFAQIPEIRYSALWPFLREGFWYVVLALIISVGAYSGEVLRSGLLSVPKGELEAGRAFGMSSFTLVRRIWLPRAFQLVMPTLAGETVWLLKSTALASTVAIVDLMGAANFIRSQTAKVFEPLLVVAVIYILLTLAIEWFFRRMEKRHGIRQKRA